MCPVPVVVFCELAGLAAPAATVTGSPRRDARRDGVVCIPDKRERGPVGAGTHTRRRACEWTRAHITLFGADPRLVLAETATEGRAHVREKQASAKRGALACGSEAQLSQASVPLSFSVVLFGQCPAFLFVSCIVNNRCSFRFQECMAIVVLHLHQGG